VVTCQCGEEMPHRRHLTWHCPHTPAGNLGEPRTGSEEGLLIRAAPAPPAPSVRPRDANLDLRVLLSRGSQEEGLILVGTDGGSIGRRYPVRRGSWAAAVMAEGAFRGHGGHVPGLDQTARACELWALIEVLRAAVQLGRGVWIIIHNLGVANGARQIIAGGPAPTHSVPAAWAHVAVLIKRLPAARVDWVPSHGKRPDWSPSISQSADHWRSLNSEADAVATHYVEDAWLRILPERNEYEAVVRWTELALQRQHRALEQLREHFPLPDDGWGGSG
jgi:ribonuclease HI